MLPKVAYVGTGGTIASIGTDRFDLLDYSATDERIDAATLVGRIGIQGMIADIIPVEFRRMDSTAITHDDWADLADLCGELARDPELDGIVIGHGTASLEETAWLLDLVLDLEIPVVLTGSMRPLNGISSDADANLASAVRVAAATRGAGGSVLVVLNDEIHAPRSVTKSHTLRLNAFQSPGLGPIGCVDGPAVRMVRAQTQARKPRFARNLLRRLPRVDIAYSYAGADGCAIRAFVEAGARGIVSAGFGPGIGTPAEVIALGSAVDRGVAVVQSTRSGSGAVVDSAHHRRLGIIAGSDLNPPKARILLALCLARGDDRHSIEEVFHSV